MGEVFAGRYEFLEPIGHGGMGTIWLIWDTRDQVHRAAKLLRQSDAGSLVRFVREQSVRIDHEHCVTPRGWSAEDDRVLFTMDLVRGGSVHDLLGDYGALPAPWATTLMDQLLLALEAVHGAGIVHRDVKPANLLLEPTGRGRPHLRLSDFGVAVALTEPRLTQAATVLGTPGYRAPEQLAGADPHPAQDLWAAGVVLVEMLTGDRPPNEASVLGPTAPPGVEPRLWQLAHALTQTNPTARPPSAAAAREGLRRAAPVNAHGASPAGDTADIEVLEHISPPDRGARVCQTRVPEASPPSWARATARAHDVRAGPRDGPPAPSTSATRGRRPRALALGWITIVVGVALLVAAAGLLR